MPPRPFKIVVLDNDLTTGCFTVLFAWYRWLRDTDLARYISRQALIAPFLRICEDNGILRPGLHLLLLKIRELSDSGNLDFVVIYTNQSEAPPDPIGIDGEIISIPRILRDIYDTIAGRPIIDHLMVRPHEYDFQYVFLPKGFNRVFQELGIPRHNWNARNLLFFDDMATEDIHDDDVIGTGRAHVHVSMYTKRVPAAALLELCLATLTIAKRHKAPQAKLKNAILEIQNSLTRYNSENDVEDGGDSLYGYIKRLNKLQNENN